MKKSAVVVAVAAVTAIALLVCLLTDRGAQPKKLPPPGDAEQRLGSVSAAAANDEVSDAARLPVDATTPTSGEGSILSPPDGVRVFSGIVRDPSGPLSAGWVSIYHPLRMKPGGHPDLHLRLDDEGAFRVELPSAGYDGPMVFVNIADELTVVFSGMVELRENLDLLVTTSAQDPETIQGDIYLPDVQSDDRWWALVMARSGLEVTSVAAMGDGRRVSGQRASVRLPLINPIFREVRDPVVLVIVQDDKPSPVTTSESDGSNFGAEANPARFFRRTFGHVEFDSLAQLAQELRRGLRIQAPLRRLQPPRNSTPVPTKLIAIPVELHEAFYMSGVAEATGHWPFYLPDGQYFVTGWFDDGIRRTADLEVTGNTTDYEFDWVAEVPGPASLRVVVRNAAGQPMTGTHVRYAAMRNGLAFHMGQAVVGDDGAARIDGLLSRPYTFQVGDRTGSVVAVAECDPSHAEELVLEVTELSVIVVQLLGAERIVGERIASIDTQLWWRLTDSKSSWREVPPESREYAGLAIAGVPWGQEVEVAVRGPWWYGRATVRIAEDPTVARVVVEPLAELTGMLVGDHTGTSIEFLESGSQISLPWETSQAGSDGAFSLEAPLERIARGELVVHRGTQVVARHRLDGKSIQGLRIQVD